MLRLRSVDGHTLKVTGVPDPYSPCAVGGIKPGDLLMSFNGKPVEVNGATPLVPKLVKTLAAAKRPMTLIFDRKVRRGEGRGFLSLVAVRYGLWLAYPSFVPVAVFKR